MAASVFATATRLQERLLSASRAGACPSGSVISSVACRPRRCIARCDRRLRIHAAVANPNTHAMTALSTYNLEGMTDSEVAALMARPRIDFTRILDTVRNKIRNKIYIFICIYMHFFSRMADDEAAIYQVKPIVEGVRERGDAAVLEYTKLFDGVALTSLVESIDVSLRRS